MKKLNARQSLIIDMIKRHQICDLETITEAVQKAESPDVTQGSVNASIKNISVFFEEGKKRHIIRTTGIGRGKKARYEIVDL